MSEPITLGKKLLELEKAHVEAMALNAALRKNKLQNDQANYAHLAKVVDERDKCKRQLLEAQAQVEVMREALLSCGEYQSGITYCNLPMIKQTLAITPSEALQQYGYEQRALALEEIRDKIGKYDMSVYRLLSAKAQEWRNKK